MLIRNFLCLWAALLMTPVVAGSGCEWCGTHEAPAQLDWTATIAADDEPGQRMMLTGVVYHADGKTPAPDVIIYAYQTNAAGSYPKRGDETDNARRHGYLRAWVRTDEQGRYRFETIKPGSYPGRDEPAHVHMTIKEPDKPEYWIGDTLFAGDPLITAEILARGEPWRPTVVVTPVETEDNRLIARRDVMLMPPKAQSK